MNEEYINNRIKELTKDYNSCISGLEEINKQKIILNNRALTISGQIQELTLMKEQLNPEKKEDNKDKKEPDKNEEKSNK